MSHELSPKLQAALEEDAKYPKCAHCGYPRYNHSAEDRCPLPISSDPDDLVLKYLHELCGTSWEAPVGTNEE